MEKYIGSEGVSTITGATIGSFAGPVGTLVGGLVGDIAYKKGVYGMVANTVHKTTRAMSVVPVLGTVIRTGAAIERKL